MKKILGIIACFLFTTSSWGQGFSKAEYFFDADPGINNGTSINLSSATDTFNFTTTASTISLSAGFHFLGLRVLHNDGVWSMFETRKFYITSPATTDVTDVVAAEYFFDTDPGPGNGFSLSVGATGGIVNFTAAIPTSFTSGFHWLAIRTKDAEGKWSMFETRKFYISPPVTNDVTDVVAAEYFLDTDPGVGNGSPLSVGATGGIVNFVAAIPTSYTTGFHLLAIRTKDAEGKWGLFESRRFYIIQPSEDMPVITAAEYFFDTDPGPGNAYPLAVPAAGNNVILSSTILAPCLPIGQHFVGLRVRDQLNQWGLFGHDTISIVAGVAASVVTPAGPLTFCEPDSMLLSTPAAQGVTYQWLKNGAVIPGATTTTYYVLATGNYAVQAFCNASTAISNVVSVTVYVPPVITFCPPEVNANNTIGQCGQIITYPNAIASGNPVPVITYSQNSGTFFPVDTTTVMVIATNLCSSDTCTFLVIVKDNESPVPDLATLPDVTGQCSATATAPSATDNCAGSVIGTTSDSTSYSTQGTRTITWTYNDGKGNTSTQSQTVIVHDTQNPVILGCPANIITNPNPGSCTKVVTWTAPTATDNCGVQTLTSDSSSGSTFPLGTTTVTFTATDIHGNSSSCSFTVTVNPNVEICNDIDDDCDGIIDEGCPVNLDLLVFIEGFYIGGGLMNNLLFNYDNRVEVPPHIPNPLITSDMSDSITISAIDDIPFSHLLIDSQVGILKTNGDVTIAFGPSIIAGNNYYLKINHRNSVETWSSVPVTLTVNTTYLFSSAVTQAYGSNQATTFDAAYAAMYSGDINQDGAIDGSDFLEFDGPNQAGAGGYEVADLNGDGAVDGSDFLVYDPNNQNGVGSSVPTP